MLRHRAPWGGIAVFVLALLVRLFYLHEISDTPLFATPVVDARTYVEDARYLADVSWSGRPAPFWQPPLYPYALGALFAVFGDGLYLPRILQALLGALVCLFIWALGRKIFDASIGLAAGFGAALYGPLIYFGGELLPALPAICLNLWLLYLLAGGTDGRRSFCAGILAGLAALTVANILLFMPVLCGWLYWVHRRAGTGPRRSLSAPALLLLGSALVITPVALRNWAVGDDLVLISHNAGINFYIGNNPDYERTTNIRPGREWTELVETPEREAGIDLPSAKSRYFLARAWDYIAAQPLNYLGLLAHKAYLFARGDEIPRNLDPYFARNNSQLLSLLLWKYGLAFPFGLVGPLALIGLYTFYRIPQSRAPEGRLLLLFLACYALSVILFFVTSRYRLPTTPVLLLLAGCGARALWQLPRLTLLALPLLLILCNVATGAMNTEGDVHEHYWLGHAYEQKGMPANAARHYRKASELDPAFGDPLLNLAAIHGEAERFGKAAEQYRRYLDHRPDDHEVRFLLGNVLLLARRYDRAAQAYATIAAGRPAWAAIHGRLGYAYLMSDRPDSAAAAYRRTLALNPDSTLVRYQLGRLYASQGEPERAADEFERLIDAQPTVTEHHIRLAELLIEGEKKPGIALGQSERLHRAEELLHRSLELEPANPHPLWSLGMLYARQGRYLEAIPLFEQLLAMAPRDYQAHLFLGHLYKRTGRTEDATARFDAFSRGQRAHRLEKTARREFESKVEEIFGG